MHSTVCCLDVINTSLCWDGCFSSYIYYNTSLLKETFICTSFYTFQGQGLNPYISLHIRHWIAHVCFGHPCCKSLFEGPSPTTPKTILVSSKPLFPPVLPHFTTSPICLFCLLTFTSNHYEVLFPINRRHMAKYFYIALRFHKVVQALVLKKRPKQVHGGFRFCISISSN